jgi:toxin-antitoxin system PIN domain toxin
MRSLLDVNVLIALLDADHSLHSRAADWLATNGRRGWASCPITQNGCVRIMSHPAYPNAIPVVALTERLRDATADPSHEFFADVVSLLDDAAIDSARIHTPRQITDTYLLALAVANGARFVTFDRGIALSAVRRAKLSNLLVL